MQPQKWFKQIVAHAKEYGFVFPSSEIYEGVGGVYDYGPFGVELKNNLRAYWWRYMVHYHSNVVGLDAAIFMHPRVWEASGHVAMFHDPMVDNLDTKNRYRADQLIEAKIEQLRRKKKHARAEALQAALNAAMQQQDMAALGRLIEEYEIADPESGSKRWTAVRQFNLMFSTRMGATDESSTDIYLRPETAQGIFVNFLNVQKTARQKVPFGIAQVGKAFRNEIVTRQFLFRMREFEQMEMQFFVRPGTEMEWFSYWKEKRLRWFLALGLNAERFRYHDHENLAHYANAATDIEYAFPIGFREVEGIHSRTDFDLRRHAEYSGKKLTYYDPELKESYVPYVVETSIGLDRLFFLILSEAYAQETVEGKQRTVLRIPAVLAPYKVAIFPLVRKDGLPEKAMEIFEALRPHFNCFYEEKDSIGKRYRRQDAVGTPYCITIDHQTLEDNTVTLRDRDSMQQERVEIPRLIDIVKARTDWAEVLRRI